MSISSDPAIRAVGLTKRYRSGDGFLVIFEDLNFEVERGEKLWRETAGKKSVACAGCHQEASMRGVAASYPKIASGKRKSNPIQVAAIVIWATLSVCIFSTSCNLALAGSVARSNSAAPPDATQLPRRSPLSLSLGSLAASERLVKSTVK